MYEGFNNLLETIVTILVLLHPWRTTPHICTNDITWLKMGEDQALEKVMKEDYLCFPPHKTQPKIGWLNEKYTATAVRTTTSGRKGSPMKGEM